MNGFYRGMIVDHPEFGRGEIIETLGQMIRARFLGEELDVDSVSLRPVYAALTRPIVSVAGPAADPNGTRYIRAFEAINLGIVPADPDQLIALTIGGEAYSREINRGLEGLSTIGLCKAVFGYYGSGKTHYLSLVKAQALRAGFAVAFVEFDPKGADPAKPHLAYRNLMAALEFPKREDGTAAIGLMGLVKEVRDRWDLNSIRALPWFQKNPWFSRAFSILLGYRHDPTDDAYVSAVAWLSGERTPLRIMHELARNSGSAKVPLLPLIRETAEIYVFNIAVVAELCRAVGYRGLLLILDEAEHVRGFNVLRKERANNFFEFLSRCAHPPVTDGKPPILNEHGHSLPSFWKHGPHFGLYVGLTEGDTFSNPRLKLREACVFLHDESDRIFVKPPRGNDYGDWCVRLFTHFANYVPEHAPVFAQPLNRTKVAQHLGQAFSRGRRRDINLRDWTKLANLACAIQIVRDNTTLEELLSQLSKAADQLLSSY